MFVLFLWCRMCHWSKRKAEKETSCGLFYCVEERVVERSRVAFEMGVKVI